MANPFDKFDKKPEGTTFQTNPYAGNEQAREEERLRLERERLELQRQRAAAQAEKDAADAEKAAREATDAEKEAAALEAAQRKEARAALTAMETVIQKARQARTRSNDWFATGFGANTALKMGGTSAVDVRELLKPIKANEAFGRLQAMREASPTGGALGAVSERELGLLESTIAGLEQDQSDALFQQAMDEIEQRYTRAYNALQSEISYYNENGSLVGYTPPDDEFLNRPYNKSVDPIEPTAAGSGATETSILVPDEMQAEYRNYIDSNWGQLDAADLSRFVSGLEAKYNREVQPLGPEGWADFVDRANAAQREGAPSSAVGPIPATNRELSAGEQVLNDVVTNPFGAGVASFANSLTLGIPTAMAGRERMQAIGDLQPEAAFAGDMLGGAAGTLLTGGALNMGAKAIGAGGRLNAAMTNPLTADVAYGTTFGALSDDDAITGALTGFGGAIVGDQIGRLAGRGFGALRSPDDVLTSGQRVVMDNVEDVDEVAAALTRANELGVPMTLADASPRLTALGGAAIPHSGQLAQDVGDMLYRRNAGQYDRLADAVERDLGPVTNIPQRSEDLLKQARTNAGPLYREAYAAPGAELVDLSDLMGRPTFDAAMNEAYREALDEGVDPRILGFVMDEAGEVNIDPNMFGGRYSRATVAAEGNNLEPRTFTAWGGREVTKRGPLDLAGWLRTKGGLRDSGGELANMGFTNASRGKAADLVGRESEFGPLVNPEGGLDFDTAAQMAQDAGYFPPGERIDINTFLDTLRDTVDGVDQRFAMDDLAEVEAFRAARSANNEVRAANGMDGGLWDDVSEAAGPDRPFAPAEAYGDTQALTGMSWQGLDYINRGLDRVIEANTDGITGANANARRAQQMKQMLLERMDNENWTYKAARDAYGGPMQERGFLDMGRSAFREDAEQFDLDMSKLTPEQAEQVRLGIQSGTMRDARRLRNNSNPWAQMNTREREGIYNAAYGSADDADVARLLEQRDLELRLAGNSNRLTGGSQTQPRQVADAYFSSAADQAGLDVGQASLETLALGAPVATIGQKLSGRFFADRARDAAVRKNEALADEIGPLLFAENSPAQVDELLRLAQEDKAYQEIVDGILDTSVNVGRRLGTGASAAAANTWVY